MNLCIQNIIDWLEEKGIYGHFQLDPGTPTLKSVEWLTDEPVKSDRLYVVPHASSDDGTILTYGNGILYYESADPEYIFNEITNVFNYYNTLENDLLEAALKKNALSELVHTAQKIFGTDIIIFNEHHQTIAKTPGCTAQNIYACMRLSDDMIIDCGVLDYPPPLESLFE